jgi:hypothetical protein
MGFLRRLLGSPVPADADANEGGGTDEGGAEEGDPRLQDDPTRARELSLGFEAGLDDLARRQLRYADLAWLPPSQLRREGDWILMERWEARREDGRTVTLKSGERLTYVGEGLGWPGATRFTTAKGDLVDLPPGQGDDGWPDDLQRPRSPTAGPAED